MGDAARLGDAREGDLVCAMAAGKPVAIACIDQGRVRPVRVLNLQKKELGTMSITPERKQELIKEYGLNEGDTGSADVQIAVLTERIRNLTEHLKTHKKDFHSRRGLLVMVGQRRRMLDYVKRTEKGRYEQLLQRLGLRRQGANEKQAGVARGRPRLPSGGSASGWHDAFGRIGKVEDV
eukprot:TRINITY_DN1572_c0_g1_i1.p2 TRINITY_DN1572_c0_g1~~TRINITY_DN1572_c0_g1_i1.p2  ORF type:complete len:179 (-),score=15.03 TRINITY_DN1572_c0_g1_i1:148-684(-)